MKYLSLIKKSIISFIVISCFSFALFGQVYEVVTIEKEGKHYSLDVKYPNITDSSIDVSVRRGINSEIENFVKPLFEDALNEFLNEGWTEEELRMIPGRNKVAVGCDVARVDGDFVSLQFEKYFYGMGAAHGFRTRHCFNYDVENQKIIALKDIFVEGVDYLKQISDYCVADLNRQLNTQDSSWVKEGASANEDNLKRFTITDNSLIIYFNDYQVACYAAGSPKVEIPFEDLEGIVFR